MELNQQSKKALAQIEKKLENSELILKTNLKQGYLVALEGEKKEFIIDSEPREYSPSPYLVEYCKLNKRHFKNRSKEFKRAAGIIIQSLSFIGISLKTENYKSISGFRPSKT